MSRISINFRPNVRCIQKATSDCSTFFGLVKMTLNSATLPENFSTQQTVKPHQNCRLNFRMASYIIHKQLLKGKKI